MMEASKKEEFTVDQYIGKLLDNRYEILELVGVGGMARVYKARCHRLNRLVAIKILRSDLAQDAEIRRRFHDESQAVAMLSHPNIMAVYDVSRSSELEYIVMELIDGVTLKQYMQKKGNQLNWREALHFITQVIKALGHAHSRGIIHRDIKPHNIMVLRDGSVKVADFGIARVASGGHSTLTQEALGSVHYISPEQARGSYIDTRSDLYSAGVVLYEMITGRLPFEGDTPVSVAIQHINSIPLSPRELDPSIPEALEAITMKAMAPNVDNRYPTADAMLADLEEFRKNPNINFDYTIGEISAQEEIPSTDRTQVRGVNPVSPPGSVQPERRRRERDVYPEYDPDEDEPHRGSVWPIFIAVLLILGFVGGTLYIVFESFITDILAPAEQYTIPSLTGQMFDTVSQDQALIGGFVITQGEVRENEAPAGTILKQSPDAGLQVPNPNTEITVVVSSGPKIVHMISVNNTEYLKALVELQNMGLKVATPTYENSDEVETGYIISALPLPGTPMRPNQDEVQLVVSLGPETKRVRVLDFVGQSRSWAESKLELSNLQCKVIETYSETIPAGEIIDQNPQGGTEVDEGSTVNLEVSLGPDPSTIPAEVSKTVVISMPLTAEPGELLHMTVTMNGETVLDKTVDTAMQMAVPVTVSGTGHTVLSVYFNGVLDHNIPIDFGA